MASTDEENISGRRTRSSRKTSLVHHQVVSAPRSTRRSSRKHVHEEQLTEHEAPEIIHEVEAVESEEICMINQSDIREDHIVDEDNEDGHGDIIYETVEEVIEEVAQDDNCILYDNEQQEGEMYTVQDDEQINTEVPLTSETGIDEKSSSFPFGMVGHSETSEDAQNEEEEETSEGNAETGVAESSLLASMAGDNANSLPSVGGGEDIDMGNKRDGFESKSMTGDQLANMQPNCEKMDSDESLSEPAIAEDNPNNSGATIVNTEMVSEDELPLPTKPEINDAEEVSDEELPAPQRAELPADAEVISEDELPSTTMTEKHYNKNETARTTNSSEYITNTLFPQKRKADVGGTDSHEETTETHKNHESSNKKKNDEQYNPMSPTSESNDAPPVIKKAKTETVNETEHKEKKKDRERDKDKEREKDKDKHKEKDTEKDKEKEKERKKLPDLDKYWRAVKDDPADFTGWTYLLQYVDNESDAEAAREAYDAFLSHYPYCYGYWRKYADYEKRKGVKANCNAVFERGLEAIPLSVDLWIHYLSHIKNNHSENEEYIRSQFERGINACGLEFRSDKLWDAYIKWESDGKRYQRMVQIYDRLLTIPTQGYSGHFNNFQDLINQHSLTNTISNEEIKKIRIDLRDSSSSRSSSSRPKSRRGSSKEKERDHKEDANAELSSNKSPTHRDHRDVENTDEASTVRGADIMEVEREKSQEDLSDLNTLTEDEIVAIKDKVISIRRKMHKSTVAAITARWTYEEGIKRPYFHVKPLERCQLKNWKDYLDFEIEKGDRKRILVLFERCLIACALYDEFWLKMIRYLETQMEQPDVPAITSDVFRRACQIHHPDKPSLHLMWAAFEECQNNFDGAAQILVNLEQKCPNLLQVAYRRINVERRRGDLNKCRELYEYYISTAKNKTIAGSLAIKYARFLNKICNDLDGGLNVLRQALEKDAANTRVALQMIDLALQRPSVDENEVVLIMDKFMARENIEPEQKVLFAQRKVEFLEDFGRTAKGLQDAQRSLQLALNKASEAKKKRESSPSRKSSSALKDSSMSGPPAAQSAYNNGSTAANASYYNQQNSTYYGQQSNSGGAYPQQQSYDGYYNNWQYGSAGYSGYGQWSGYGNYY